MNTRGMGFCSCCVVEMTVWPDKAGLLTGMHKLSLRSGR
ncbi:hypothetical protein SAMN06295900_120129 [Trinickia caryophylli]|uniref:Uncharacterized protein n=1 Tax=Trinickia caryophylli TaxID=28094 RepID=A0A1X7H4E2_TRICW|nr:hypothetical protein SAMN06295900_120129 [Trinickia caryophylli]